MNQEGAPILTFRQLANLPADRIPGAEPSGPRTIFDQIYAAKGLWTIDPENRDRLIAAMTARMLGFEQEEACRS